MNDLQAAFPLAGELSSNFHLETGFPSRSKCAFDDQRSFTGAEIRLAENENVRIEELLGSASV
jgi:hypothetical protein